MRKILAFCLLAMLCGGVLNAKMSEPLKGDEYKKAFKEYFSSNDEAFNAHNFEEDVKLNKKYCDMGLADACDMLGVSYALGLGVKRDVKQGIKYVEYAIKNTQAKALKYGYKYSLDVLKSLENLSDEEAIKFVKNSYNKNSLECQSEEKSDKDACFKAMVLIGFLPNDMLMIHDFNGVFETFYKNDVLVNDKNSKIEQTLSVYREFFNSEQ